MLISGPRSSHLLQSNNLKSAHTLPTKSILQSCFVCRRRSSRTRKTTQCTRMSYNPTILLSAHNSHNSHTNPTMRYPLEGGASLVHRNMARPPATSVLQSNHADIPPKVPFHKPITRYTNAHTHSTLPKKIYKSFQVRFLADPNTKQIHPRTILLQSTRTPYKNLTPHEPLLLYTNTHLQEGAALAHLQPPQCAYTSYGHTIQNACNHSLEYAITYL